MSTPLGIWALCTGVCAGLTLGVEAGRHRCNTGHWPRPDRVPWRHVAGVGAAWGGRRLAAWARSWRATEAPGRRLAAIALGGGLIMRAAVWVLVAMGHGRDAPAVETGLVWSPVGDPAPSTRLGVGVIGAALAGTAVAFGPALRWGWPPAVQWAARAWLAAVVATVAVDLPLGVWAAIRKVI